MVAHALALGSAGLDGAMLVRGKSSRLQVAFGRAGQAGSARAAGFSAPCHYAVIWLYSVCFEAPYCVLTCCMHDFGAFGSRVER